MKLTDLNTDCLYIIFDQLDVNDLMNIVQINSEFQTIATDVFRRKYSNYEIDILGTKFDRYEDAYETVNSRRYIRVRDFQISSNIMKFFGKHIRKLAIRNLRGRVYTSSSNWTMANRIINEYGSDTLTQLTLGAISKKLWPQFTMPFKNVEKLDIEIGDDTDGMKLNLLCPNLKKLRLRLTNEANYDFIDCKLPQLDHLEIIFHRSNIWNQREQIIGLIQKNPQIRGVIAQFVATPEFNEVISEYLPNLENLTIGFSDHLSKPLHFEYVKHCVLHTIRESSLRKFSFPHLESLKISYSLEELEKYNEFFRRHRNLNQLIIGRIYDTFDLNAITAELPNLESMILLTYPNIPTEHLINFIENHPKLMTFQFRVYKISETDKKRLHEKFERDWNIESTDDDANTFLFDKKKNV